MQTAPLIKSLPLDVVVLGTPRAICPVLIRDSEGATLVDTAYPGHFGLVREAVEKAGVPFAAVRRVILTHQDWDHTGTVPEIRAALGGQVTVYAHAAEKPYLEGALPLVKLTPAIIAARIAALPEADRAEAAAAFAAIPAVRVDRTVADGDILPFHGGVEVIHAPGHTPGNLCLYVKSRRLLIAGDQLRVEDGALVGPAPEFTPDMPEALRSLRKLAAYDIDTVYCYHGGAWGPGAGAKIAALAAAAGV